MPDNPVLPAFPATFAAIRNLRRDPSIRKSEVKPPNLLVAHAVAVASVDGVEGSRQRRRPSLGVTIPRVQYRAQWIGLDA
jgi:hypothetical protein